MPLRLHYFRAQKSASASRIRLGTIGPALLALSFIAAVNFVVVQFSGLEGFLLLILAPFINLGCATLCVVARQIFDETGDLYLIVAISAPILATGYCVKVALEQFPVC